MVVGCQWEERQQVVIDQFALCLDIVLMSVRFERSVGVSSLFGLSAMSMLGLSTFSLFNLSDFLGVARRGGHVVLHPSSNHLCLPILPKRFANSDAASLDSIFQSGL
jgi:hypothetical protein